MGGKGSHAYSYLPVLAAQKHSDICLDLMDLRGILRLFNCNVCNYQTVTWGDLSFSGNKCLIEC